MTAATTHGRRRVRFSVFEVDLVSAELFKQGRKVRLQGQPFQILLALLHRPGELISREELRQKIWSSDTVVDFDHGLNRAMNKLRDALGDSSETPRFVETLPRRGYRFIGVLLDDSIEAEPPKQEPNVTPAQALSASAPAVKWPIRNRILMIAGVAVVGIATLVTVIDHFLYKRSTAEFTDKGRILLADFDNSTGDTVFDGTLRQGLEVELEQSPFLALASDEQVAQTLLLMNQPAAARLIPKLAQQVCLRTGSVAMVQGSIAKWGTQYILWLRAKNCTTGDILDEEQATASRKENVLNALSQISGRFRIRAGESLTALRRHETPLANATTSSLEALKAYTTAEQVIFSKNQASAVPLLQHAIALDPDFAMAHAVLGLTYSVLGESDLAAQSTRTAYRLRDHTSDPEKFFILYTYDRHVTGNLKKAQQTAELWAQMYPRDPDPPSFLAGFVAQGTGQYEKGIEEANRSIALDANLAPSYSGLAFDEIYLNRFVAAEETLRRASERKLESSDFLIMRYYLSYFKGDHEGMERQVAAAHGKPGADDWITNQQALVLASSGQLKAAELLWQRAIDSALQTSDQERAAIYRSAEAVSEAILGEALAARRHARASLALSKNRDTEYADALALTLSGAEQESRALIAELDRRFPEDTLVRFEYLPTLEAHLALIHGFHKHAVEALQPALPYDLALPGTAFFGFFGSLYPTYARGEAYLAAGRGAEAATEFQKILDHSGLVFADPIGATAHLQLGRAWKLQGDLQKAKIAYQQFLDLWKNADVNLAILKQAQTEYAQLRLQ